MNKSYILGLVALVMLGACEPDPEPIVEELAGNPGDPRFNLQFSNSTEVDLDLYVQAPNGQIIYWGSSFGAGGSLDVDCLCGICPGGGNENIYWEPGQAPSGTYKYWVEYFESCNGGPSSSTFTLRVLKNNQVVATQSGTLSGGKSQVWTHVQ